MAFILPVESAAVLVRLLTGSEDSTDEIFDELGRSALAEIGNIMITSYLNALSKMTGLLMIPSIPALAIDMAGAVWQSVLAGAEVTSDVTLIRTEFSAQGKAIEGNIIFLPDEEDFARVARILGLEAE
jgi:chemotaxis protein CheC